MEAVSSNKRIAKNTFFLYIRMVLVMGITLYTSRIVLEALGVKDYGIFSIIGGTVSFFTFISNSMATSIQRHLSFAMGEGNIIKVIEYFNQGFWTFGLVSIISLVLCESGGLVILYFYLDIPQERMFAAFWVFQISIANLLLIFFRVPYNGVIIAEEKMDFFAWQGIIEIILKLGIAFAILYIGGDKLIIYMLLLLGATLIINQWIILFCKKNFTYCKVQFIINKKIIRQLLSFSGWTLLSSGANVISFQGVNIVLNNIYGVVMSAATGIAGQVMGAITTFLGSFQTAFNPQITKSYAANDLKEFKNLIFNMSLLSFYLMTIVSVPILIKIEEILSIWLTTVPQWTSQYCTCIIIVFLIESLGGPFWMAMQAVGNIKTYQIIISIVISLNFFIALVLLYTHSIPIWSYIIKIFVAIALIITRLILLKKYFNFSICEYLKKVILKSIIIFGFCYIISFFIKSNLSNIWEAILFVLCSIIISCSIILTIGLPKKIMKKLMTIVKRKI